MKTRIDTGRKHGVSKIYIEPPKKTKYSGEDLRKIRAIKGIGRPKKRISTNLEETESNLVCENYKDM